MEKYKRPKSSLAPHRRRFEPLDMNKSSSSLNMSTSSLRSIGEKTRKDDAATQGSTNTPTVKFAPPPKPSSLAPSTKTTSRLVSSQQVMSRPGTASGQRPGSSAGPRCGTSAGRLSEAGRKAARRSWGLAGATDATKEERRNDPSAPKVQQVRSSSAPRRILQPEEKEKPSPKRSSKIMTPSRTKNPESPPTRDAVPERRSPPIITNKNGDQKSPSVVSLNNTAKVTPARRVTVAMIGASWDSLPSDVQSLGQEVMRHRDNAEAAAVEALQEASAADILLRCLSAFADLTSAAAEQSPQQTVDEFLALHAALTSSAAAVADEEKQQDRRLAGDWLRAAVATDLAPFSLYTATARNSSQSPPLTRRPAAMAAGGEETWLEAARRGLGEEMRAWFLGHVERLLDGDVAGTLGQLKRVSDWLDHGVGMLGSESEAVDRVRKKIYGFLLDHVESAVVALNGGAAPSRGRRQ
ncbi:hypothetical protein EJB05_50844, partial [Eragrostis curvula]